MSQNNMGFPLIPCRKDHCQGFLVVMLDRYGNTIYKCTLCSRHITPFKNNKNIYCEDIR